MPSTLPARIHTRFHRPRARCRRARETERSTPIDLAVRTIDILMLPDPKGAERSIIIEQIWCKPFEIKHVAMHRFDLDGGGGGAATSAPVATSRPRRNGR